MVFPGAAAKMLSKPDKQSATRFPTDVTNVTHSGVESCWLGTMKGGDFRLHSQFPQSPSSGLRKGLGDSGMRIRRSNVWLNYS